MMKKVKRVQDSNGVGKELRRPGSKAGSGGRLGGFLGSALKEPLGSPDVGGQNHRLVMGGRSRALVTRYWHDQGRLGILLGDCAGGILGPVVGRPRSGRLA